MTASTCPPATRPAREFDVELPIGVEHGGIRRRDAAIRKMRGYEEELLADPDLNGVQLATRLLVACTTRLAGVERPDRAQVEDLYLADRDYLLLELRRISYGDTLRSGYRCPRCQTETVVVEDLAGLPVRRLADDVPLPALTVELEDGYQDRHGHTHTAVTLRLPRGADEAFVALALANGPAGRIQAQDALMLRCIASFGSLTRDDLDACGSQALRELTVGDRARLLGCLRDGSPGVRWRREVRCRQCELAFTHALDISAFFPDG